MDYVTQISDLSTEERDELKRPYKVSLKTANEIIEQDITKVLGIDIKSSNLPWVDRVSSLAISSQFYLTSNNSPDLTAIIAYIPFYD